MLNDELKEKGGKRGGFILQATPTVGAGPWLGTVKSRANRRLQRAGDGLEHQ
jgi:hypothetical protein